MARDYLLLRDSLISESVVGIEALISFGKGPSKKRRVELIYEYSSEDKALEDFVLACADRSFAMTSSEIITIARKYLMINRSILRSCFMIGGHFLWLSY